MDPGKLLQEYGPTLFPWVVFGCAILENDITFIMAGINAATVRPHPSLAQGLAAGILGALCHDSFWYAIGRNRATWIRTTKAWRKVGLQIETWAARFGPRELFFCRFLPGTRNASLLFWGVQRLKVSLFLLIDGSALAIWGTMLIFIGYKFSQKAEDWIGRVKHKHLSNYLLIALVLTVAIYYTVRAFTRHEIVKHGTPPEDPRAD